MVIEATRVVGRIVVAVLVKHAHGQLVQEIGIEGELGEKIVVVSVRSLSADIGGIIRVFVTAGEVERIILKKHLPNGAAETGGGVVLILSLAQGLDLDRRSLRAPVSIQLQGRVFPR